MINYKRILKVGVGFFVTTYVLLIIMLIITPFISGGVNMFSESLIIDEERKIITNCMENSSLEEECQGLLSLEELEIKEKEMLTLVTYKTMNAFYPIMFLILLLFLFIYFKKSKRNRKDNLIEGVIFGLFVVLLNIFLSYLMNMNNPVDIDMRIIDYIGEYGPILIGGLYGYFVGGKKESYDIIENDKSIKNNKNSNLLKISGLVLLFSIIWLVAAFLIRFREISYFTEKYPTESTILESQGPEFYIMKDCLADYNGNKFMAEGCGTYSVAFLKALDEFVTGSKNYYIYNILWLFLAGICLYVIVITNLLDKKKMKKYLLIISFFLGSIYFIATITFLPAGIFKSFCAYILFAVSYALAEIFGDKITEE